MVIFEHCFIYKLYHTIGLVVIFTFRFHVLSKNEFQSKFFKKSMGFFNKWLDILENGQRNLSYDNSYMQQWSKIFGIDENYHPDLFIKN